MKKTISNLFILALTAPVFADPSPSVKLETAALGYPYTNPFQVSVTFSEPVTGFGKSNVNIVNASITDMQGGQATYVLNISPKAPGPMTIFIPSNEVKSLTSGSANKVSNKLKINALNPILNPSGNFDLKQWSLILPLPLGELNNAITIAPNTLIGVPILNTGYTNPPYFFTDEIAGSMNFFAPLNGATTPNSFFPRSELSEVLPNIPHTWQLSTYSSNTMSASVLITEVPPSSKKIVIGKIQDKGNADMFGQITASKPLVKIYYDLNQLDPNGNPCYGCIYARIRPVPAQDMYLKTVTLAKLTPLNKLFQYKITLLNDGTLTVKVNNASTTYNLNLTPDNTIGWGAQELFFKAGVYLLENGSSNAAGGAANFYSLQATHTL